MCKGTTLALLVVPLLAAAQFSHARSDGQCAVPAPPVESWARAGLAAALKDADRKVRVLALAHPAALSIVESLTPEDKELLRDFASQDSRPIPARASAIYLLTKTKTRFSDDSEWIWEAVRNPGGALLYDAAYRYMRCVYEVDADTAAWLWNGPMIDSDPSVVEEHAIQQQSFFAGYVRENADRFTRFAIKHWDSSPDVRQRVCDARPQPTMDIAEEFLGDASSASESDTFHALSFFDECTENPKVFAEFARHFFAVGPTDGVLGEAALLLARDPSSENSREVLGTVELLSRITERKYSDRPDSVINAANAMSRFRLVQPDLEGRIWNLASTIDSVRASSALLSLDNFRAAPYPKRLREVATTTGTKYRSTFRVAALLTLAESGHWDSALSVIVDRMLSRTADKMNWAALVALNRAQVLTPQQLSAVEDLLSDDSLRWLAFSALAKSGQPIEKYLPLLLDSTGAKVTFVEGLPSSRYSLYELSGRAFASRVFAEMWHASSKSHIPSLLQFLQQPGSSPWWFDDFYLQSALAATAPHELRTILTILNARHEEPARTAEFRFAAHYWSGGRAKTEEVLKWLGSSAEYRASIGKLSRKSRAEAVRLLIATVHSSVGLPHVRQETVERIAEVSNQNALGWSLMDVPLAIDVEKLANDMDDEFPTAVAAMRSSARSVFVDSATTAMKALAIAMPIHLAGWVLLALLYPRYQWARRVVHASGDQWLLTWGYMMPLVRLIKPLRRRLLLAHSCLLRRGSFASTGSEGFRIDERYAVDRNTGAEVKVSEDLTFEPGLTVIVGRSGLGKTVLMQSLASTMPRPCVLLHASSCKDGVLDAVSTMLPAPCNDHQLIQNAVESSELSVLIDGLNEVEPEVRSTIFQFAHRVHSGRILVAGQATSTRTPAAAAVLELQPFREEDVEQLLNGLAPATGQARETYLAACDKLLCVYWRDSSTDPSVHEARRVLSNPFDLQLAAELLLHNPHEIPDPFRLLEAQFERACVDFDLQQEGRQFRRQSFCRAVFDELEQGNRDLVCRFENFDEELEFLATQRLVVKRIIADGTNWQFRHERVRDFFVALSLVGENAGRQATLVSNELFAGAFLLLSTMLPSDQATALRELLVIHAADSGDHRLSDEFVRLLRDRVTARVAATNSKQHHTDN